MSKAEDLLNSLDETDESLHPEVVEEEPAEPVRMAALYSTTATETEELRVIIFEDRSMYVPESVKKLGVQYDHDVNLVHFDCPRYSDGIDLYPMQFYVNYIRPDGTPGAYHVEDVTIDETDSTILHFSWHVLRHATEYQGNLTILVCVKETDDSGNLEHHWNTELNADFYLSEGLECADTILAEYPDIITQLLTEMDVVKAIATPEAMQGYANAWLNQYGAETVRSVEQKGQQVLASIPEDYTQLSNDVNELKGDLAKQFVYYSDGYEFGGYKPDGTKDVSSEYRIRTVNLIKVCEGFEIENKSANIGIGIYQYDENKNFISNTEYKYGTNLTESDFTSDKTSYVGLMFRNGGNTTMTLTSVSDVVSVVSKVYVLNHDVRIFNLEKSLSDNLCLYEDGYEFGAINNSGDKDGSSKYRVRTVNRIKIDDNFKLVNESSDIGVNFACYDSNELFVGFLPSSYVYGTNLTYEDINYDNVLYIHPFFRKSNNTIMELTDVSSVVTIYPCSRITKAESDISELSAELHKNDMKEYTSNLVDTVTSNLDTIQNGNSVSSAFSTDIHTVAYNLGECAVDRAMENSVKAIEEIGKTNNIDFTVLGGDYLYNLADHNSTPCKDAYKRLRNAFYPLRQSVFALKGNHDDNTLVFDGTSQNKLSNVIYDDERYLYLGKQYEKNGVVVNYGNNEKSYGYYDIPCHKVRCIFINTSDVPYITENETLKYKSQHISCVGNEQLNFSAFAIKLNDDGWSVVFFSHHTLRYCGFYNQDNDDAYLDDNRGGIPLWGVIQAFRNKTSYIYTSSTTDFEYDINVDYTNNGSNDVIAAIGGHTHKDFSNIIDGVNIITTVDACTIQPGVDSNGNRYTYTADSANETAWDIFTFDTKLKKIYATRYGVGTDREWNY